MTEHITRKYIKSNTHYIIIDCGPLKKRPDEILKTILHEDEDNDDICEDDALLYDDNDSNAITIDDFTLVSTTFGAWKYIVFKEKELLFEAKLPKIIAQLTSLYNCGIIRYAEWSPNQ